MTQAELRVVVTADTPRDAVQDVRDKVAEYLVDVEGYPDRFPTGLGGIGFYRASPTIDGVVENPSTATAEDVLEELSPRLLQQLSSLYQMQTEADDVTDVAAEQMVDELDVLETLHKLKVADDEVAVLTNSMFNISFGVHDAACVVTDIEETALVAGDGGWAVEDTDTTGGWEVLPIDRPRAQQVIEDAEGDCYVYDGREDIPRPVDDDAAREELCASAGDDAYVVRVGTKY